MFSHNGSPLPPRVCHTLGGFLLAGIVVQFILDCIIFGIRILHYSDNITEAPLILMISHTIPFFLSGVLKDKNSLFKEFIKREKSRIFPILK
jgi:hypothetical protein